MNKFVGIDPAQRHTGLCILQPDTAPLFYEVKTTEDVLTSSQKIRGELQVWLWERVAMDEATFAVEKQLSKGGHTSALLFFIQMTVLEVVQGFFREREPRVVMPLPIQLTSFMKKRYGVPIGSAAEAVGHFKDTYKYSGRISQHCVDAFYLAQMAREVEAGEYGYPLPSKEAPLVPWRTLNGERLGTNLRSEKKTGEEVS